MLGGWSHVQIPEVSQRGTRALRAARVRATEPPRDAVGRDRSIAEKSGMSAETLRKRVRGPSVTRDIVPVSRPMSATVCASSRRRTRSLSAPTRSSRLLQQDNLNGLVHHSHRDDPLSPVNFSPSTLGIEGAGSHGMRLARFLRRQRPPGARGQPTRPTPSTSARQSALDCGRGMSLRRWDRPSMLFDPWPVVAGMARRVQDRRH